MLPEQLLQHHINRAAYKLAKIKRRDLPSQEDQRSALAQRKRDILQSRATHAPFSSIATTGDRFASHHGRIGVVMKESSDVGQKRLGMVTRQSRPATNSNGYPSAALAAANSNGVQSAKAVTTNGSLGLDIEANDVGYIATIQIGSNHTDFRMLIDSGSADTWIPVATCSNCGKSHKVLSEMVSTSLQTTDIDFSILYGTGAVSGYLGSDDMSIAGFNLTNHSIALINKESNDFIADAVPFDGLMGLAKKRLSNSGKPTPIDALYASKQVDAPVMGYHLARASDDSNDGLVTFGGVDASKIGGKLIEIPNVSQDGFYEIAIESISYDGKVITGLASNATAILDTGTTLMVAPLQDAKLIHDQIVGAKADGMGGYTIPCNTTQQLAFSFGGQLWPLRSEDMIFLPVDENDLQGQCISALSGGAVGADNEWLLGASFLKNVYFATNAKENVIGLGLLAQQ